VDENSYHIADLRGPYSERAWCLLVMQSIFPFSQRHSGVQFGTDAGLLP
jgi:hypothetical protein